jgi:hypothetical protein
MRSPSEQKSMNRRNGQCLDALPLAQKLQLQLLLAGLHLTTLMVRSTRRWEAEGVEKEAKV